MCKNYLYCAVVKEPLAGFTQHGKILVSVSIRGIHPKSQGPLVGLTGLEPVTLRLSSACSNQLSYRPQPKLFFHFPSSLEAWGFEPQTYSLQSYRSTN